MRFKRKRTLEDHTKAAALGAVFGFVLSLAVDDDFMDFLKQEVKKIRTEEEIVKDALKDGF